MKKCHIAYLACAAALMGAGIGAAPPAAVPRVHVVLPGQSIQKAVDAAVAGDTVQLLSGTYHESVEISTSGVTLRGLGSRTVIRPAAEKAAGTCAQSGNGICVTGTADRSVENVTVASLTVTGFTRSGLFATETDRLNVRKVTATENGVWGIAQEHSVRGEFRRNTVRNNGDAGLFLANAVAREDGASDSQGAVVAHNRMEGNRIGVTVRRLRNLVVAGNQITGNCAGVFVVGDENTPKAGALTVAGNLVVANNKSCPKTARLEALQGSGIVVTGAEETLVTRNLVRDNAGTSSLSGGIVLFKSFVGSANERNRISGNVLDGNSPADLVNTDPAATTNIFEHNNCRASQPEGLC
ncbi:nitrous oxide reductase family maturation protein NosD [Streptomyces sp. NPDC093094]|uniref:right-handed parallel beta-helix repeat-containing protein n=1 Tax=Streptomyces sp. NPDC093094 TaxID=3366026 RepID=UPI0037F87314